MEGRAPHIRVHTFIHGKPDNWQYVKRVWHVQGCGRKVPLVCNGGEAVCLVSPCTIVKLLILRPAGLLA